MLNIEFLLEHQSVFCRYHLNLNFAEIERQSDERRRESPYKEEERKSRPSNRGLARIILLIPTPFENNWRPPWGREISIKKKVDGINQKHGERKDV